MIIREFQYSDLQKVYQIETMSFSEPYSVEILIKLYELGVGFLVAEEEGIVIGYILFWIKEINNGHIISLAVDENYRGTKIGSNLLRSAITIFIKCGINKINLEVKVQNINAIEFYKSFGFVIDREEINYYEDGSNAFKMHLDCPS
ncbi:MAG: ribosomal protein S18-alanine N-acetyltransferase [Methanobacteriaceae archaeon]|nr:ribosomal protein S18-alanine N-acetyltransferase [Methanobacteriaceae archaeon]